ncbi:GtrA family protein [Iodidimonas sp. SYSU 1G8]|uniref:GtrA family protein n=1 Tax=Iodidimonas sp. SYSU 1G8 TaxID=3133967 RepID=UPI0031FF457D
MPPRRLVGQFLRFGVVGTLGFAVDSGVLYVLLQETAAGPWLGRILSFLCAASVTWALNRSFTFADASPAKIHRQWALFVGFMMLGGAINYGVYALVLAGGGATGLRPLLAVACGSIAGLAVNFTTSRLFVFRDGVSRS